MWESYRELLIWLMVLTALFLLFLLGLELLSAD